MAIKGKRKSKGRSGRAVSTAPRPFLVPPKVPLFRRPSFQLALALAFWTAVSGLVAGAGVASDAAEHRRDVTEFGTLLEGALQSGGVAQMLPGGPLILPELGQTVAQVRSGEAKTKQVAESAGGWSEAATRAADRVAALEAPTDSLRDGKASIAAGLRLYATIADELAVAAGLEGASRKRIVDALERQLAVAGELVDRGWSRLQEERDAAGIAPQQPGLPPGLPPGLDPGGLPPGLEVPPP